MRIGKCYCCTRVMLFQVARGWVIFYFDTSPGTAISPGAKAPLAWPGGFVNVGSRGIASTGVGILLTAIRGKNVVRELARLARWAGFGLIRFVQVR